METTAVVPECFISFAAESGFLGAVVVATADPAKALEAVTATGINPGGEALIFPVLPGLYPTMRLLSREDLRRIDGGGRTLGDLTPDEFESLLDQECNR